MIECKKSTVSIIDGDILFINVERNQEFSLSDYKEVRLASLRLVNKKEVFSLIHLGDRTIPDKEAREACSTDTGNGCIRAEAFIVHSLGQRIVVKHILKEKSKHIPTKLFTNIEKAKVWLNRVREDTITG